MCRGPCRASEVVGLQFELTKPPPELNAVDADNPAILQLRLSTAQANLIAMLDAEATRQKEHDALKDRVTALEGELNSHVERASVAEARAMELRARLVRAQASRSRLSAELLQIRKEMNNQATWRQYLTEAGTMSQTRAVEFFQEKSGEDLHGALCIQHSAICELQNENARLRSEKLEQRRQLKAEIERKDVVIQRLRATDAVLRSPEQPDNSPCQQTCTRLRGTPSALRAARLRSPVVDSPTTPRGALVPRSSNILERCNCPDREKRPSAPRCTRAAVPGSTETAAPLPKPRLSKSARLPAAKKVYSKKSGRGMELAPNACIEEVHIPYTPVQEACAGKGSPAQNKLYRRLWPSDIAAVALGCLPLVSVYLFLWMQQQL